MVHPTRLGRVPAAGGALLLAALSGIACGSNEQPWQAGADAAATGADGSTSMDGTSMDGSNAEASSNPGAEASTADAPEEPPPPPPPDPVIPLSTGTLKLEVWGPKTIRVLYGLTSPDPSPSLAVTGTRPSTYFTVIETATQLTA